MENNKINLMALKKENTPENFAFNTLIDALNLIAENEQGINIKLQQEALKICKVILQAN